MLMERLLRKMCKTMQKYCEKGVKNGKDKEWCS